MYFFVLLKEKRTEKSIALKIAEESVWLSAFFLILSFLRVEESSFVIFLSEKLSYMFSLRTKKKLQKRLELIYKDILVHLRCVGT